ncbi:MAG: ferrous iron transport protein B [Candidatus Micrarchaeia archaeon]
MIRCALVGNPNVGKSTLFNLLTKGTEHIGNWPGKTVECKQGHATFGKEKIAICDLPGSYSLSPFSDEEKVVVEALSKNNFDVILQVADACNLERNLYFTIELLKFSKNVIVAINKSDCAKKSKLIIDEKKLQEEFGIPFVKISAKNQTGINELLKQIIQSSKKPLSFKIPDEIKNREFIQFEKEIRPFARSLNIPSKWLALKLIEKDSFAIGLAENSKKGKQITAKASLVGQNIESSLKSDIGSHIAKKRYCFLKKISEKSIKYAENRKEFNADKFILNPFAGIPIFILILWLTFQLTFILSAPFSDLIDEFFINLGEFLGAYLQNIGVSGWAISLLQNGIIAGVGGILIFTPTIIILFILLYTLEDSGYMARVAVILDGIARKTGLSGKSFIPLILGFGCNVPAIMSARILDKKEDRLTTMILIPFMSCAARLPVYLIFIGVFFSQNQGLILLLLYLLGIILAIITSFLLRKFIFKSESGELLIELPKYHFPSWKVVLMQAKHQTFAFIYRAGTIILVASIFMWFLSSLPYGVEYGSKESISGIIGGAIAPVLEPLGFGTWQASVSLIFGFVAKEVVVSSMLTSYGVGEEGLTSVLKEDFTTLSAISFMVFVLLYVPCIAVIGTLKRETNSWKITLGATIYYIAVAWIISFLVFQIGLFLGY